MMSLRERILHPMDLRQRAVFAVIFGLSFVCSILGELVIMSFYGFHSFHIVIVFGAIQLFINPQGIRLLFFLFFAYLLLNVFTISYDQTQSYYWFDPDELMFGFPLYVIGFSQKVLIYTHIALYALLAYFAFNNPLKPPLNSHEDDVIDQPNSREM